MYVLHDIRNPEAYGGLPANPRIPLLVRLWKGPLKWIGSLAMFGGVLGVALHYPPLWSEEGGRMILRYTLRERVMHWLAGFTYLYLLTSGLAFFAPQLYWMAAILGGGPVARFWHPWAGLAFTIVMLWMHQTWRADMRMTETDRRWMRAVRKLHREQG